jgi:hypothetical protein
MPWLIIDVIHDDVAFLTPVFTSHMVNNMVVIVHPHAARRVSPMSWTDVIIILRGN